MKKRNFLKKLNLKKSKLLEMAFKLCLFLVLTLASIEANASSAEGGTLPISAAVTKLANEISGPFMFSAAVIMVCITALLSAFGEFGDGAKKIINITFWLSMGFGVTSLISNLFATGAVF